MGEFKGNISDAMRNHENMKFTTFDRDNDSDSYENCAVLYNSSWWYNNCFKW
ncbi:hypothetical protein KR215_005828 [Drosophila sulfurigaster]|nr:hypothetical protein KR215_005828 [Drosophila sulfurigaster]